MDKKLTGLIIVFFLVFGVFISLLFFNNSANRTIRASNIVASCPNSYLFVSNTTSLINKSVAFVVYIRSSQNEGVSNTSVNCKTTLGTITPENQPTSKTGTAEFTLQSNTEGIATITCAIPQCPLPNSVSVQFTNQ